MRSCFSSIRTAGVSPSMPAAEPAARAGQEVEAVKGVPVGTGFRRVFPAKMAAMDRMVTRELTARPELLSFRSMLKRSRI
jgi:hypothetical protein